MFDVFIKNIYKKYKKDHFETIAADTFYLVVENSVGNSVYSFTIDDNLNFIINGEVINEWLYNGLLMPLDTLIYVREFIKNNFYFMLKQCLKFNAFSIKEKLLNDKPSTFKSSAYYLHILQELATDEDSSIKNRALDILMEVQ